MGNIIAAFRQHLSLDFPSITSGYVKCTSVSVSGCEDSMYMHLYNVYMLIS